MKSQKSTGKRLQKTCSVTSFILWAFMRHYGEQPVEHIKEYLDVAETAEDPDYYFLTVEYGRKLYEVEIFENIFKEAIYMASTFFKHPYEMGKAEGKREDRQKSWLEGKMEGRQEGRLEGMVDLLLKQLSKKFGILPLDMINKLKEAEQYQLELIAGGIFDFQSINDIRRYLQ